jgi:hypothetical protein
VLGPTGSELQSLLQPLDYAVLTIDLLTPAEAGRDQNTGWYHLDVPFLTERMCMLLAWIRRDPRVSELMLAIVAKGTTLAAALMSASHHAWDVQAVVSYHGRPDLAGNALPHVRSSVLLITDEGEPHRVDLNRQAAEQLTAFHKLEVLPRESDASEAMAAACRITEWLEQYLAGLQVPRMARA